MKPHGLTISRMKAAGIGVFFRPRDLEPLEVSFADLQQLVAADMVEKLGHGRYRLAQIEPTGFETVAMVCSVAPGGIVCLLSALRIHEIGTQAPHEVWLALDRKARKPAHLSAQVRIVRFSGPMLAYGIQKCTILGVPVRVTSPARTVVDCFRYRYKIGINVGLEALRDSVRSRKATVDEIVRAAEVCRARTVLRAYLEALEA